jgi:hypothetical protein
MSDPEDVAERRFTWLARQRGCTYVREDKLEAVITLRGTRPDFYVRSHAGPFLAEVKAFEKPGPLDTIDRIGSRSMAVMLKPISAAIDEARRQLRPYRDGRLPMIVVLDPWRQRGIDLSNEVLIQVFGELSFVVPVARDGPRGEVSLAHGGGRTIGEDAGTYISAVVVNIARRRDSIDDFTEERPMRARVVHNPFASVPLPTSIFASPDDEQLVHDGERWQRPGGSSS